MLDVSTAGSVVRVELQRPGEENMIQVELPRIQEHQLNLTPGNRVYLRLLQSKVFLQE